MENKYKFLILENKNTIFSSKLNYGLKIYLKLYVFLGEQKISIKKSQIFPLHEG
jgi:hypothetical protein